MEHLLAGSYFVPHRYLVHAAHAPASCIVLHMHMDKTLPLSAFGRNQLDRICRSRVQLTLGALGGLHASVVVILG